MKKPSKKTITTKRCGDSTTERNPAIFAFFLVVGQSQKEWANRTWDDAEWRNGACDMSLDMLNKYHSQTAEQLAAYDYDYWLFRSKLTYNPYGGSQVQCIDPHANNMWEALEQGDPSMLFKHYGCFTGTEAA